MCVCVCVFVLDICKAKQGEVKPKPEEQAGTSATAPPTGAVSTDDDADSHTESEPRDLLISDDLTAGSSGTSLASSLEDLAQPVQESIDSSPSARAPTPPIVGILMDMGFSRAQVNIALNRFAFYVP